MNQQDAERYTALYRDLYQTQQDLEAQAACPNGHPFSDGCSIFKGQVTAVKMNTYSTPKGRVICRLCANKRASDARKLETVAQRTVELRREIM